MSLVPPPIEAVQIPDNILDYRPVSSVTPFTYRSGMTYQALLEALRVYATSTLVNYMQDEYGAFSDSWEENLNALIGAVNTALSQQATTVNQQLAQTLAEILAGANVTLNDANILNALKSAGSTSLEYLDGRYDPAGAANTVSDALEPVADFVNGIKIYYAPAPTGGDDTATLLPYLTAAQATNGELRFGHGTWRFNLATEQQFIQPRIVGSGKNYTFFQAFDQSKTCLRFQGGSGSHSGGYISDVTFNGTGNAALELADVCDVTWDRIGIAGAYQVGILFNVTQAQGFTEFCRGEATIETYVSQPIEYRTVNSQMTSFHGSGLTDGIVNWSGASAVKINNYCYVYNAPMSATFFAHTANTALIQSLYAGAKPWLYGTLRVENQAGGVVLLGASADDSTIVLYAGQVIVNTSGTYLSKLYIVKRVYAKSDTTEVIYDTFQRYNTLNPGGNYSPLNLSNGGAALVVVNLTGPNYGAHYELMVWQNPYSPGGTAVVLASSLYSNASGIGDPVFAVDGYQLKMTNNNFTGQIAAFVSVTHLGGGISTDNLRQ